MVTKSKHVTKPDFAKGYTEADWDAVESPELTPDQMARMRPAREVLPAEFFTALEEARRVRGRPPAERVKKQITLRLDEDVVARFRESGKGWQGRMNEALRKAAGL